MTGAHIAYWFAKRNRESAPCSNAVEKEVNGQADEGDEKKSPVAPPQVLYCGPSNKSVDVVSGIDFNIKLPLTHHAKKVIQEIMITDIPGYQRALLQLWHFSLQDNLHYG